jgi:serine/threonine protein kinase
MVHEPDDDDRLTDSHAAQRVFAAVGLTQTESAAGSEIAGYVLDEPLGKGGGGTVYKAWRPGAERPVALKLMSRGLGAGDIAQRAWRELGLLSQLRLPCVPQLIDYGEHNGHLFVVTEFVEGPNLAVFCDEQNLDRRERVKLLVDVARAVQMLHEHGILHRDIKPGNVLVNPHGQPMIVDLGIASLLADDVMQTITQEGLPIGTPAFMAPEQARGERSRISTRTDVFGLGATAWLLLVGATPFDVNATIHEAIRRIAHDDPRAPRSLDASLPRQLAAVLEKATARRVEDRYATAGAFVDDLERWLQREPVEAHPPTPWAKSMRWLAKHPIFTTISVCVLIAIGSLFGTTWMVSWLAFRPNRIVVSEDGMQARLVSRNENTLHTWHGPLGSKKRRLAVLVDGPNGPRTIIGFGSGAPKWGGLLCAFDVNQSVTQPVWTGTIESHLAPDAPPGSSENPGRFRFVSGRLLDCFDPPSRQEILVQFKYSGFSPAVLRIYSLEGELLFQVCHDGGFGPYHWQSESGILVLGGQDEPGGAARGLPAGDRPYLRVVMALRPKLGFIDREYLNWSPGSTDASVVVWYMAAISPDPEFAVEGLLVDAPFPHEDEDRLTRVSITYSLAPKRIVSLLVDGEGNEYPNERVFVDVPPGAALPPAFESEPLLVPLSPVAADASTLDDRSHN